MNSSSRGCVRSLVRQHWLNIGSVALAALMAGCGGGGSSHGNAQTSQTPYRVLNTSNAEAAVKLTLEMTDVTDALTASFGLGSGTNESRCQSGSGIGVVTGCVIGTNTFDGSVTATVAETKTVAAPSGTGSRTMPTSVNFAITNLQWQSSKNQTVYTINGNLAVTYAYPISAAAQSTASVTGTLTLTDSAGKRYQYRSLTQRYTVTIDTTLLDYQFEQTDRKGALVYLDEDRQYSIQPGTLVDYLSLVGDKSKLSLNKSVTLLPPSDDYSLRIDTDNDGNYDTFASIPVSEIGLGHTANSNPVAVSVVRQGGGGATPVGKNQPVTLTAAGSDADHNFFQYSWAVTSQPPGATGDNAAKTATAAQSTGILSFTGSIAGPYTVVVTATEVGVAAPTSATATIIVNVSLDTPQLDVANLQNAVGSVGAEADFPVTLTNLEGPITTTLLGAPAGMTLGTDNVLRWIPQRQFFPGSSETVTLQVSNGDQTTVKSYTVTVNGAGSQPLVTPGLAINDFTTDATLLGADSDTNRKLLLAGSGSVFFGLDLDGSAVTTAIANPYMVDADFGDNLLAVKPLHTNGALNGTYAVATRRAVFIVDATTFAVRGSKGLQLSASKRRFAVTDVDGDGTDEIIALTTNNSTDHLYVLKQDTNLTTLAELQGQSLGQQFLVGNVDIDSAPEIVCGNGLVLNAANLATKYSEGALSSNWTLADVDGDGFKEIVQASASGFDVLDVDTNVHTSIPVSLSLSHTNLFALDAAGDTKEEVLIGNNSNQVYVYSINKSGATASVAGPIGTAAANSDVTEVVRGDVINSNGGQELVIVSTNSGGGALISVAPLNSTALSVDGTIRVVATNGFAAARALNPSIDSDFFTASLLGNVSGGLTGKGLLGVGATGAPAVVLATTAAATALFAASGDIDNNGQQDFVVNTKQRTEGYVAVTAQLTGIAGMSGRPQVPITNGTPAPIALGDIDDSGNIDAVYVERTGDFTSETVDLVVHEVKASGTELARVSLQSGGPVLATPVAVAIANLDGNANPDIVVLDGAGLRTFEYSGGALQPKDTLPLSGTPLALAVGDIDGDGRDEIAVTRTGVSTALGIYNGSLGLIKETAVTTPTAALTLYHAIDARPLWLYGSSNKVVALDASTLTPVWTSPALHGQVNSVDVLTTSIGDQLRIGTEEAIYRSQP